MTAHAMSTAGAAPGTSPTTVIVQPAGPGPVINLPESSHTPVIFAAIGALAAALVAQFLGHLLTRRRDRQREENARLVEFVDRASLVGVAFLNYARALETGEIESKEELERHRQGQQQEAMRLQLSLTAHGIYFGLHHRAAPALRDTWLVVKELMAGIEPADGEWPTEAELEAEAARIRGLTELLRHRAISVLNAAVKMPNRFDRWKVRRAKTDFDG